MKVSPAPTATYCDFAGSRPEVLAGKVFDARDVETGIDDFCLARSDPELADRLDLLTLCVQHHRVNVSAGTGVDVAGDDLVFGRLARTLVDESHVEVLCLEVAELLGEHVRQVNLLVQPADHDLQGDGLLGAPSTR